MGSKSKQIIMKSNRTQKTTTAQSDQKKENALDIVSKSAFLFGLVSLGNTYRI